MNFKEPDIFEEIVRLRQMGKRAVLATIVRRTGSTPRKDHARLLVSEDGLSVGTVGGGCVEAEIWAVAPKILKSGQPQMIKYQMTDDDAESEGLICGGTVEIFVEPILPPPSLLVLGAGHLGQAIAELAGQLGFAVTVVDDRERFANRERFPGAQRIVVQPFSDRLDSLEVNSESYILVVTRGHKHDQIALESAIKTSARYVGMVGSRRKIQLLVGNLLEKGHAPESFANLYAPIGLDIGSETPQEIAVAVAAELIAVQKGVHRRSPKQEFILKMLQSASEAARPSS